MSQVKKVLKCCHTGIQDELFDTRLKWDDLKYKETGDSALHVAARMGYTHIIKQLLATYQPTTVDVTNNDNKTPLHEAAQFGHTEVASFLIENGANVNALKKADWTPLMLACTKNTNQDLIKLLIVNGAAINYANKDGWTVDHLLARDGSLDNLKLLHSHGLDLKRKTKNGRNAVHIAALHNNSEIIRYHLENDASLVNSLDNCGNTPLHESVLGRNYNVFKSILESGGDISLGNSVGFNALHLAASMGDIQFITVILGLKVDINIKTDEGLTALHCAARKNFYQAYKLLIELGADSSLLDVHGRKPGEYFQVL